MGGEHYLAVQTERSKGLVTAYRNGEPERSITTFVNYVVLPARERVETKSKDGHYVEVIDGDRGWLYSSLSKITRDLDSTEMLRAKQSRLYQIDSLLRGGWRQAKEARYLPAKELWRGQRADAVLLVFPDNSEVSIYFDFTTRLPVALRFPAIREGAKIVRAENRFYRYVKQQQLQVPYVVDLYENDLQVLRVSYESREFNVRIDEKLFARPK
ncbi:MAG: hypothetical protein RMM17_07600 [Acidobacteriota bacterium]|nr:hypothetical protein [Blastocatellia bacterium]MDW8412530.1 hypothetical protein [Acidobacteriota bacterium]